MLQHKFFYRLAILIVLCAAFSRCKKDDPGSSQSKTPTGKPGIGAASPSSGKAGDVITITGLNFFTDVTQNVVKLGKGTAQVTQASSTQLSFVVPPEATRFDSIVVTTPNGSGRYQFTTHVTITDFTPSSGPSGTKIKIAGTGLNINLIVSFNGGFLSAVSCTPTELVVASSGPADKVLPLTVNENLTGTPQDILTTTKNFTTTSVPPVQVASFPGTARGYEPTGFAIGPQLYFGLGTDTNLPRNFLNDFWKYDSGSDTWTRVADFPGGGRQGASAFSFNGKGYVIGGAVSSSTTGNKDVWQYDPQLNTWKQLSDFPGAGRVGALCFVLGQYVYFGNKDFWRYDPANDTWVQKADFGGGDSQDYAGVAIGNLGYVTGGFGSSKTAAWSYDPATDTWNKLSIFFGIDPTLYSGAFGRCVGFGLKGVGYFAKGSLLYQLFPEINPSHNISWVGVQTADAVITSVSSGVSTINDLGSGHILTSDTNAFIWYGTSSFWKFTPPN